LHRKFIKHKLKALENIAKKIILTGATGLVGEGVLLECLQNPLIEEVLVLGRKPNGIRCQTLKNSPN
jgi:FlaA1/EpsC-like NDP-sugar epimerase